MKKTATLFLWITLPLCLLAQDTTKQKEIGITFYGLNDFGLSYKVGSENALWRFQTLYLTGSFGKDERSNLEEKMQHAELGFRIGREHRTLFFDKLEWRFGWDVSFSFLYLKRDARPSGLFTSVIKETLYQPGLNLVLGLNYLITDHIAFGVELLPGVSYGTGTRTQDNGDIEVEIDVSEFNIGFSSNAVLLSLNYRF
jgi:hypothetical protein